MLETTSQWETALKSSEQACSSAVLRLTDHWQDFKGQSSRIRQCRSAFSDQLGASVTVVDDEGSFMGTLKRGEKKS